MIANFSRSYRFAAYTSAVITIVMTLYSMNIQTLWTLSLFLVWSNNHVGDYKKCITFLK